jgi:hypothetical protein
MEEMNSLGLSSRGLAEGRRQSFGTQLGRDETNGKFYISPLEDPDHVDERRAKLGLQPLAEFASYNHFTWDVEAYKRDLPQLESCLAAAAAHPK